MTCLVTQRPLLLTLLLILSACSDLSGSQSYTEPRVSEKSAHRRLISSRMRVPSSEEEDSQVKARMSSLNSDDAYNELQELFAPKGAADAPAPASEASVVPLELSSLEGASERDSERAIRRERLERRKAQERSRRRARRAKKRKRRRAKPRPRPPVDVLKPQASPSLTLQGEAPVEASELYDFGDDQVEGLGGKDATAALSLSLEDDRSKDTDGFYEQSARRDDQPHGSRGRSPRDLRSQVASLGRSARTVPEQTVSEQSTPLDRYLRRGAPSVFWPRQGYFKNTYLGGDLEYEQALKQTAQRFQSLMTQREHHAWSPPLDAPREDGISLSARLSHAHFAQPQRVILQVALKGSERFGWRRPALNTLIALDPSLLSASGAEARQAQLVEYLLPVLRQLNAADQVGLAFGDVLISPRAPDELKRALINPLRSIERTRLEDSGWSRLLDQAEAQLNRVASDPHRVPGTQTVLMMCGASCSQSHRLLKERAHALNLNGTLTSVIDGSTYRRSRLWEVAAAGHGGYWRADRTPEGVASAVQREFQRFSRVVARLLRLSVKLSEGVELVEILGTEMLSEAQKQRVKAREVAMDRRLSARLGIASDRGEDDEGVQVVIPAFYGADTHLIHLSLWVTRPGQVAEVNLKYKDLVRAQNASASSSVTLSARRAPLTLAHREVREGASQHLIASRSLMSLSGHVGDGSPLSSSPMNLWRGLALRSDEEKTLLARSRLGRPMRRDQGAR